MGNALCTIGGENKNFEENYTLSEKLEVLLENEVKGISRGITKKSGNSPFPDPVVPNSLLENQMDLKEGESTFGAHIIMPMVPMRIIIPIIMLSILTM